MAVSRSLRFQILRRDNHACKYCGRKAPEVKLTIDHVVPETLGGSDHPSNLVTACADCNGGKSAIPPDAALVAQVADDAARWAAAQRTVAEAMLADLNRTKALLQRFEQRWHSHGRMAYLETGWERSIERFLVAGLPVEVILDCLDKAMAKRDLRKDAIFKYACGIAWARIREMREQVAEQVGVSPDEADEVELSDLLDELTGEFGQEEIDKRVSDERFIGTAEEDIPFRVASSLAVIRNEEFWSLAELVDQLFEVVPVELMNEIIAEAERHRIGRYDDEFRGAAMSEITRWLAGQYLDTLDEAEVGEWVASLRRYAEHPSDLPRMVAAAARKFKYNGEIPAHLCQAPGQHGAACPERTEAIRYANCEKCKDGSHDGHFVWCAEHLRQASEGELLRSDGTAYKFVDAPADKPTDPRS